VTESHSRATIDTNNLEEVGSLSLGMYHGLVEYRCGVSYAEDVLTKMMIRNVARSSIRKMDSYLPRILRVMHKVTDPDEEIVEYVAEPEEISITEDGPDDIPQDYDEDE